MDEEHILVGLSSSPSNTKIVEAAARMSEAFGGSFTALYVSTPDSERMSEEDRQRLKENIRFAEKMGAEVSTVYGENVPYQVAEFARISRVTKIVIGRSSAGRCHFWNRPSLTEELVAEVPNIDIYIIPDFSAERHYWIRGQSLPQRILPSLKDLLIMVLMLAAATALGMLFSTIRFADANIITIYILGALLTALFTRNYLCSVLASLASVLLFNFLFTEPVLTLHAYASDYPITFGVMLIASLITVTLANRLMRQVQQSARAAVHTKVLFDTNSLLQKAADNKDAIRITAGQLTKLSERDVIVYPESGGHLDKGYIFSSSDQTGREVSLPPEEKEIAEWALKNRKHSGATTDVGKDARYIYYAIYINSMAYGVVAIDTDRRPLEPFEKNILVSILGECALTMENISNLREKEQIEIFARNEQLRANLLRAISHDLRTPLTSISGNAETLISGSEKIDDAAKKEMLTAIYDDSMWLISLVENLLAITRIGDGSTTLNMSSQLVSEVVEEAMRHIDRKSSEHDIRVDIADEFILAKMDVRLIVQTIINLVDNAVKYTPEGSMIVISAEQAGETVSISVADNGPGIADDIKTRVFEMFFTGTDRVADSRRGLGLGLALCRSIINAHGGEITLTDNKPHGCVFTFTLPADEVRRDE